MTISFNSIPVDVRTFGQYVEFDSSRAVKGLSAKPKKALIIAQKRSAGTMTSNVLTRVPSYLSAQTLAGIGSILSSCVKAYKANDPYTDLWAVGLADDAGGTAATGTLTVTASSAKAGTLFVYVAGVRLAVAVSDSDSATTIAAAIVAKVTANPQLPVTAANSAGVVTFTCRHKGTLGNQIDVRVNYAQGEVYPSGVSVAIVAMASGATDPDVTDATDAIGDVQFDTIVCALNDATSIAAIESFLDTRWGPMVQKEGQAFFAKCDTQGNLTTLGSARNSKFSTIVGASTSPTPAWQWAAAAAAADTFESDPARPRQTLELTGILPAALTAQFTRTERAALLASGIATHYVDDGGIVRIERLITTYQTNALSAPDTSYLDLTSMRTLAYLRWSLRTMLALKFPRCKLASDGTLYSPGQAIVTPSLIKSEVISLFQKWQLAGLVESFDQFVTDLIVERNETDPNRIDVVMSPDLINQFIVFAGQIQFLL